MQIRMFCPRLGWFKGMLMKKPSITKVQLPESMKKVQQSRSPNCSDDAHLLVIQTFPTLGSRIIRDKLDNKPSPKSVLAKNKPLNDSYKKLLESNGIYQNDCEEYENYFKDYDQGRRNDGSVSIIGLHLLAYITIDTASLINFLPFSLLDCRCSRSYFVSAM